MVSVHSQRQQQVSTTRLLWFNQHSTCSKSNSTAGKRENQGCGKSWLVGWRTAYHALQSTTGEVYKEVGRSNPISNISGSPFAMVSSVWLDNNTPLRFEPSSWFISLGLKNWSPLKTCWQDYRRWPPIVCVLSMLRLSVPVEDRRRGDINSKPASVFTISTGAPQRIGCSSRNESGLHLWMNILALLCVQVHPGALLVLEHQCWFPFNQWQTWSRHFYTF